MSNRKVFSALFVVILLTSAPLAARADRYDSGMDAYQAGDYQQALQQWEALAEQGHAQALYNLGFMYEFGYGVTSNDEQAFRHYLGAALLGHTGAQQTVAWLYERGKGVTADMTQAARWYGVAANAKVTAITPRDKLVEPKVLLEQLQTELQRAATRYDQQKALKKPLPLEIEASNQTS